MTPAFMTCLGLTSTHRTRRRTRWVAITIVVLGLLGGCAERTEGTTKEGERTAASTGREEPSVTAVAISAPSTHSTASASPAASAAAETGAIAGTWEGTYDAKKGTVEMPAKVKDKARAKDDGKTSTGSGSVTLTISSDGEITGNAKGALGDATLRGKVEGAMVRASVFPDNPTSPSAMTGVLVGMLKDGAIRAELRVAGPDALIVRESAIELKRK